MRDVSAQSTTAAVFGGGPAGLMAAEALARAGCDVTVYDHMRSVGRKFLLAGRGGLNISHSDELDVFLSRYGAAATFIESAFTAFSPTDLRTWCADLGEPAFVGSSGRLFPASFRATPLLRAWLSRLTAMGVAFRPGHRWDGFAANTDDGPCLVAPQGTPVEAVAADISVLALGGASRPRVGSTGMWVEHFRAEGIGVTPLSATNCGVHITWTQHFLDRFEGHPLKNVAVTTGEKPVRGDCVVTGRGLEGGPIYAQSGALRSQLLQNRTALLRVDLQPDLTSARLRARLERRRPKESVSTWLRKAGLSGIQIGLLREATANQLPLDTTKMGELIKSAGLRVESLASLDRAISTAGGVLLDELDDNFMLRRRPGVFVAGEMLDWEAPTGGYLLQACLSTGAAAGAGALAWLDGTSR